jgi:cytosine/uracil/thiamine/allantoin permease
VDRFADKNAVLMLAHASNHSIAQRVGFIEGRYYYAMGINPRAVTAPAQDLVIARIGLLVAPFRFPYDYARLAGFFVSGAVYVAPMRLAAPSTSLDSLLETGRDIET